MLLKKRVSKDMDEVRYYKRVMTPAQIQSITRFILKMLSRT
ncbi:MAG: hypothetical protein ACLRNP_02760 [Blautia coccoides]